MNADGSAPTRLTDDPATDNLPSISPDGTRGRLHERPRRRPRHLRDGHRRGNVTRLTTDPGDRPAAGLVARRHEDRLHGSSIGEFDIFVMNAGRHGQTNVTNNEAEDASASWSPDGIELAFASTRDGNPRSIG